MDQASLPPHVLIFPLPLQGPVNSMFKLAELLCLSGLHVTFLLTKHTHGRLFRDTTTACHLDRYPGFRLETIPDGLPADHPRSGDQVMEILDSLKSTSKPLFKDVLITGRPVTCVIADGFLGFTLDVAKEMGIPVIYSRTLSACCLWIFYCLPKLIEAGEVPFQVRSVPGMEPFLRRRDLPSFCRSGNLSNPFIQLCMMESEETPRAYGLIINTFEELEGSVLSNIRTLCPNLYTIGPLHAHLKTKLRTGPKAPSSTPSNSLWQEDRSCMAWLDAQVSKSVIYVSFGSLTVLSSEQLMEIWNGLVNSETRFLWVIRPDLVAGCQKWGNLVPAEKGYIVSWAPQEEVLSHPSMGGFLTHSGWNSTLESVYEGVPMICCPTYADQQVNSRFVEEVWKVGLDMKDCYDQQTVEKTVRDLMEVRKDEFASSAEKMAKLAKEAVSEGGSSNHNLVRLIKDIEAMDS
ncbi:hypothetical protein RJ639_020736 [Escallonia herrerae]|uniref:Glycosyltransferase n=1 Tax=Escallonia herrerae TaxID=1293975 RepID=A0AA88V7E4_9ASTE|nr:hypothetical protein RJ639_020736 [Escallonia herrerae]